MDIKMVAQVQAFFFFKSPTVFAPACTHMKAHSQHSEGEAVWQHGERRSV